MNRRWLWQLEIVAACLASASFARAELKNCTDLNAHPADYKVLLDDFSFSTPAAKSNTALSALNDTLRFNFNGQLEKLKASIKRLDRDLQVPLRLVPCAGRQPSITGNEFTAKLAERLTDERVVMEMWGTLDLVVGDGPAPLPRARIGYSIPPVQHYVKASEAPPVHIVDYPKAGGARSPEELENLSELAAFALVGLGTKAARAGRYDLAVWAFTRAEAGIADAQLAGTNPDLDALLAYVKRAACRTRTSARDELSYSGALKLVPAETCPEAP